jgi:hypothetical protein
MLGSWEVQDTFPIDGIETEIEYQKRETGATRFFLFQFGVIVVAILVTDVFFLKIPLHRMGQIHARLVGETDQNPKHISHFIRKIPVFVRLFEGLFAVFSGHDTGEFTDFLHKNRSIREFIEISDPDSLDPLVYQSLCFGKSDI